MGLKTGLGSDGARLSVSGDAIDCFHCRLAPQSTEFGRIDTRWKVAVAFNTCSVDFSLSRQICSLSGLRLCNAPAFSECCGATLCLRLGSGNDCEGGCQHDGQHWEYEGAFEPCCFWFLSLHSASSPFCFLLRLNRWACLACRPTNLIIGVVLYKMADRTVR